MIWGVGSLQEVVEAEYGGNRDDEEEEEKGD